MDIIQCFLSSAAYDIYDINSGERTKLQPPESVLRKLAPPRGQGGGPGGGGGPPPDQGGSGGFGGGNRPPPQLPLMLAGKIHISLGEWN